MLKITPLDTLIYVRQHLLELHPSINGSVYICLKTVLVSSFKRRSVIYDLWFPCYLYFHCVCDLTHSQIAVCKDVMCEILNG